jgi:hypothetical protein
MPRKEAKPVKEESKFIDVRFPLAGLDLSMGFGKQPNRPTGVRGEYRRTCAVANNVRGYEPETGRSRGGQRSGLSKYIPTQPTGEVWVIQELALITKIGGSPVQLSQSGRVVSLVAVSEGRIFVANAGDDDWVEATNNTGETPPLNATGIMFSAPNQQKLYFVDGINAVVLTPITNTVELWTATAGTFPVDSDNNLPRLICLWRGRTCLSGLQEDPQNIFMSAVDGPTDFDYAPLSPSALDAVALNISEGLGLIGDVVNCMIPFSDDVLVVGCDSHIFKISGDPNDGGQIDLVSSTIGMAWGQPFCIDPNGQTIYFFANHPEIFALNIGQGGGSQIVPISSSILPLLQDIDTGTNSIRMIWNHKTKGFHVFITPLEEPGPTTHFYYEARSGAWFTDTFANENHNPLCCVNFDGNTARDRVALIGSWDGYVRALDPLAVSDDGTPILSEVTIGPILTSQMDTLNMKDICAEMGVNSQDVEYDILDGETAEEALSRDDPFESGIWTAGRNPATYIRASAHALYVRVRSKVHLPNEWSCEKFRLRVAGRGKVLARSQ